MHSLYNDERPSLEWSALNFNQHFNNRKTLLKAFDNSNYEIGNNNKIAKRLTCLNDKIELDWLNKDKDNYKIVSNFFCKIDNGGIQVKSHCSIYF